MSKKLEASAEFAPIFNRIIEICNSKNIAVSNLLDKFTTSRSAMNAWKKGNISANTAADIANELNVSIEFLITGKEKSSPMVELTNDEQILLNLYKNLSETNKARILERAITLTEDEALKKDEASTTFKITYYTPIVEKSEVQNKKDLEKRLYFVGTQVARRTDGKFVKEPVTAEEMEKIKALPEDTDF